MSIFDDIDNAMGVTGNEEKLTLGQVVDTNDPQQMGRVRVACPFFGDNEDTVIADIPWATPISPLAGSTATTGRGREDAATVGPVSYGMFNIPKVGAFALVACVEGDPRFRVYLGCVHDQFLPHTMPHGRYTYKKTDTLDDEPSGPLSASENVIQPLHNDQTNSFTKSKDTLGIGIPNDPRKNYEYRTRGADNGVAGNRSDFVDSEDIIFSAEADDVEETFTEADGKIISNTHGYKKTRVEEGLLSEETEFSYDPQVYSWTTPGFHSISMSDAADNCRIRVRSTHGHQIIMDDTNERIYLSTANGKTWIELDEAGNIDIYGERNISVHAEKDINFTAGDTFRVKAANGIHLISEDEIRMHSKGLGQLNLEDGTRSSSTKGDLHIKSDTNLKMHSIGETRIQAESDVHVNVGGFTHILSVGEYHIKTNAQMRLESALSMKLETATDMNVKSATDTKIDAGMVMNVKASGGTLNLQSSTITNILAGGNIQQTAPQIHLNGPGAGSATPADPAITTDGESSEFRESWWTNRIPEHEPWARVMTKPVATDNNTIQTDNINDHDNASEYSYDDPNVGRMERGEDLNRNEKWHR